MFALVAEAGSLSRRRLAALLWSGVTEAAAAGNLRQRLFRLRRLAPGALEEGRDGLRLRAAATLVDPIAGLADDPDAATGDWLGDWRYDDEPELAEQVALARLRWTRRRRERLLALAIAARVERRLDRALAFARRLLALDPADEAAHRELMQVHLLRGDALASITAFDDCVAALAIGPGAEPQQVTVKLYRSARAAVDAAGGAGAREVPRLPRPGASRLSDDARRLAAILAESGPSPSVSAVYRRFRGPAVLLVGAWQELEQAGFCSGLHAPAANAHGRALAGAGMGLASSD